MTKRAVILHGTDGSPTKLAWQAWLKSQLESRGYEVFFPQLPDCHRPDVIKYDGFLRESGWDFSDNLVIGHSSGATEVLHLLQQDWFPHVEAAVLVGTFLTERLVAAASWYDPGQFSQLFVDTFQPEVIKQKAARFYFVHGDDDPYCDYDEAQELCTELDGQMITLPGAGHIASSAGIAELPQLIKLLEVDGIIGGIT